MNATTTIVDLAKDALKHLERTGTTGSTGAPFCRNNGSLEWLNKLVFELHKTSEIGELPPDDWRYYLIWSALSQISESTEEELEDPEPLDHLQPGTWDLLNWISSNIKRLYYCDAALEEYGLEFRTTHDLLELGFLYEYQEVFYRTLQGLYDVLEAEGEE